MRYVKLEDLNDYVSINETKGDNFIGYTTETNRDINGKEYELEVDREKYCYLGNQLGNYIFISQTRLIESLLQDDIDAVDSGKIYEHGYPESRLVPVDHTESCEEVLKNNIMEEFETKVDNIFSHLLKSQRSCE